MVIKVEHSLSDLSKSRSNRGVLSIPARSPFRKGCELVDIFLVITEVSGPIYASLDLVIMYDIGVSYADFIISLLCR